jgi:Iron-sulfur cluster assembly accessory protein
MTATLKITDNANNQFKKILLNENNDCFVRILVDSGGCSGFSYKFSVDNKLNQSKDTILSGDEKKPIFVIDMISLTYINNSHIDWIESLTNSQFIINNPLAKSSCGCGSSFSL